MLSPTHSEDTSLAADGREVRQNFSRWFAQSAMIDRDGKPRVFFHGTNQPFDSFKQEALGRNTASVLAALGYWLTSTPETASEYADMAARTQVPDQLEHERKVADLLARIEKAENKGDWAAADRLTHEVEALDIGAIQEVPHGQCVMPVYARVERPMIIECHGLAMSTGDARALIHQAKAAGHDGILFKDSADTPTCQVSDHLVVFSPTQIKSALGNPGLFVTDSPSLTDSDVARSLEAAAKAKSAAAPVTRRRALAL